MPITDEIGNRKSEFIADVNTFLEFLNGKYPDVKDCGLILSAISDTHHEMPEKRYQTITLLAGTKEKQSMCVTTLMRKEEFFIGVLKSLDF